MKKTKFQHLFEFKKTKFFWSLLPFYLMLGLAPLWIELFFNGFMDTFIGYYLYGISIIIYFIFLLMVAPFEHLFRSLNLMDSGSGWLPIPEITFWGLIILSLFYSILLYIALSFISYLRKSR